MKVDFPVTFTAKCDIEDAFNDFEAIIEYDYDKETDEQTIDKVIYQAIEENMIVPKEATEYLPQSVVEEFANALRKRIGGVQLEMDIEVNEYDFR